MHLIKPLPTIVNAEIKKLEHISVKVKRSREGMTMIDVLVNLVEPSAENESAKRHKCCKGGNADPVVVVMVDGGDGESSMMMSVIVGVVDKYGVDEGESSVLQRLSKIEEQPQFASSRLSPPRSTLNRLDQMRRLSQMRV
ncbi:hypothetical protein L1887_01308 [Cichorium endivia]|nr:hypothetical protein L1887_01308 [Cichorium endivia]